MNMLNDIRKQIDEVDDEIAKLYVRRMSLVKEVGLIKAREVMNLENVSREKEILNRVASAVPEELKLYIKQVFTSLFETSKAYQQQFLNIGSDVKNAIKEVLDKGLQPFPIQASVACQGVEGSFSNIAAEKLFALSDISYFKTFDAVFAAVEKGFCRYGVLPIENSSVGSVNQVYDLMKKHNFYIVRSVKVHVQHQLLARRGVQLSDIKEIISQEQALGQCQEFLKTLNNVKVTVCENTAVASRKVAASDRNDIACIASRESARLYDLAVLRSNVQDRANNFTRFIAISKKLEIYENADKISIMVTLPHEPGSLNRLLNRFSALGLNLTKLESRPLENSDFEFAFYFDFEADVTDPAVLNLLAELSNKGEFIFLGSYREVI
jgi:chorismate mutase/prephenate dehydratase